MKYKQTNINLIIFILIIITTQIITKKQINKINDIINRLDYFKRSLVTIISRTDTPFISEIEEVTITTGFIVNKENLLILTTKNAARISPSNVKVQFYDGKIVNAKIVYSGTTDYNIRRQTPFRNNQSKSSKP